MDHRTLPTDQLADYIDRRYAECAPQWELDELECIFAARVTEEDLSMSEDELSVTEMELDVGEESAAWASLEEQLMHMYYRFISPDRRGGMEITDIIVNMHAAINCYRVFAGSAEHCAAPILEAGRDAYERRMSLLQRLRQNKHRFGVDVYEYLSQVGGKNVAVRGVGFQQVCRHQDAGRPTRPSY
jgi:hypothetical protein